MSTEQGIDWLNRLAKWRVVFAGWQLGTRAKGDPESDAVRDHRELSMLMRCELNALAELFVAKGIFTREELTAQVQAEARLLCEAYERTFPGFSAVDDGIRMDPVVARRTTEHWYP